MKTGKIFSAGRKDFTKSHFSELSINIAKKRVSARFCEIPHSSVKSDVSTREQDVTPSNSDEFTNNQIIHQTAKLICLSAHTLRRFHNKTRRIL